MTATGLLDVAPILMLMALGVVVRVAGLAKGESRLVLTRLAYHLTIPATLFTSIARARITSSMLLLPAVGFLLPAFSAGVLYLTTRRLADQPKLRGAVMVSTVVLGVFGYPFFRLFFGQEGLAHIAMYDVGNAFYAATLPLWLAHHYGSHSSAKGPGSARRALVTSPVLWATVMGVLVSWLGVPVAGPIGDFLDRLAAANTPLAMIAVGTFIDPRAVHGALIGQFILIRMVLGAVMGWLVALALGMTGLDLVTCCLAPALPAGTTGLVYASNEGLDAEFTASLISTSVIVGALLINLLPHLLAHYYL